MDGFTLEVPVTVEVTLSTEDGGAAEEVLLEIVTGSGQLAPSRVVVDCPYAGHLEFGTRPAVMGNRDNDRVRSLEADIREWTRIKLGISDVKKLDKVSRAIYKKIMREGLLPSPFLRPAIFDSLSEVREDWLDRGHSLEDIADGIAFRAKRNLEMHDNNYTRMLYNSIRTEKVTEPLREETEGEIDEYVWDSAELGADGKSRPDFRRWHR